LFRELNLVEITVMRVIVITTRYR